MAELHVEPKKHTAGSMSWLWIVLGVIIAAVIVWLIVANNNGKNNNAAEPANTTGAVHRTAPQHQVVGEVSYRTVTL